MASEVVCHAIYYFIFIRDSDRISVFGVPPISKERPKRVCYTFSTDEELKVKLLARGVTYISANLLLFCFVLLLLGFFFQFGHGK